MSLLRKNVKYISQEEYNKIYSDTYAVMSDDLIKHGCYDAVIIQKSVDFAVKTALLKENVKVRED